jgi:serine/threonine protein kinase
MAENDIDPETSRPVPHDETLLSPLTKHPAPSRLGYGRSRIEKILREAHFDYDIIAFIGRGGYGEVWLLRDRALGRLEVIKLVDKAALGENWRREFEGVQTYAQNVGSHPNLISVYHAVDLKDYFFYIMECADNIGPSIDHYEPDTLTTRLHACFVKKQPMPMNQVRRLMEDLCAGVAFLHSHRLVHRDIKPANVIFIAGRAKLTDMGCVTVEGQGAETAGTPGYLPKGSSVPQDSPSHDLYSLAMLLYVCLTQMPVESYPALPKDFLKDAERVRLNRFILRVADERKADIRTIQEFHRELRRAFRASYFGRAMLRRYLLWGAVALLGGFLMDMFFRLPPDSKEQISAVAKSPLAPAPAAVTNAPAPAEPPRVNVSTNIDLAAAAPGFLYIGGVLTNLAPDRLTWSTRIRSDDPDALILRFPTLVLPADTEISFTLEGDPGLMDFDVAFYPDGEDEEILNRAHWPFLSEIRCSFSCTESGCRLGTLLGGDQPPSRVYRPFLQLLGASHRIVRQAGYLTYSVNGEPVLSGPVGPRPDAHVAIFFQTFGPCALTVRDLRARITLPGASAPSTDK